MVARALFALPTFRNIAAAYALLLFASYSLNGFITPHLMRSWGLPLWQAGLAGGVGGGVMLGVGTLGDGFLAERLARRDRRWLAWTPALAMLCGAPLCAIAFAGISPA